MQITLSHHATTSSFKIGKRGDALTRRVSRLNSANLVAGLLGISFGQLHQYWAQVTKQPSGAMIRPGGEVDLCGRCGGGIAIGRDDISGTECPSAVDGHVTVREGFVHECLVREGAIIMGGVPVIVSLRECYRLEGTVINVYAALAEVGCVQIAVAINESGGQAGVA